MSQKLFVRNLSWSVTEDDLYELFGEVGAVVSVKIPTRREDGKPRGFAFVEMASADAADQVIRQYEGWMLNGRPISVNYQDEDRSSQGGGGYASKSSYATPAGKNSRLFVRNVTVSEDALQSAFEQVGDVVSVKIPVDRDTGMTRGYAFVEMASVDDAERAIEQLNQVPMGGKSLIIEYQDPQRPKAKKPAGGGYRDRGAQSTYW
jgi:nucleolin